MSKAVEADVTRGRYRIEALAKGLQVLRAFDETSTGLRLHELSERTGLPIPTTFRVIATLEQEGFLERSPDGVLHPGVAVLTLGSAALRGSGLVQASERPLRALAAATGETVNLGVLVDDTVLYLARMRNADFVTANIQVGSTLPAVYTSMGKVLLAYLSPAELSRRIERSSFSSEHGPNAVPDRSALDAQLSGIRADGYAIQDEELAAGLRSVSVPVFGDGPLPAGAINVAVSTSRHDAASLRGPLLEQVRHAANEVTIRLRAY